MNRAFHCVALFVTVLGFASPAPLGAQASASKAVDADEQAMAAEKRPSFATPIVEDKAVSVPGLPEKLAWYTSRPGIFGSPRAKQGGTFR